MPNVPLGMYCSAKLCMLSSMPASLQIPQQNNKSCRLSGLNNRNIFLEVLETDRPRSRCQQGLWLVRAHPWVADSHLSLSPHKAEREKKE